MDERLLKWFYDAMQVARAIQQFTEMKTFEDFTSSEQLRHERVPAGLCDAVREVTEDACLSQLLLAAAQSTSLGEFSENL